jgi:hypothetical protein
MNPMIRKINIFMLALMAATAGVSTSSEAKEMPMPPADTDPGKIVQVGKSSGLTLIGTADYAVVAAKLAPLGYKPRKIFGKALMYLTTTMNDDFVGCGCPKAFNEFSVSYVVEPLNDEGETSVVPDFFLTDHPQRQNTMIHKFGTMESLGDMKLVRDEKGVTGFEVRDASGNLVVEARSSEAIEEPTRVVMADYSLFSMGGEVDGKLLSKVFYRLSGPMQVEYDLYSASKDTLKFSAESELGRFLKEASFKPRIWQRANMRDGISWIPAKQ